MKCKVPDFQHTYKERRQQILTYYLYSLYFCVLLCLISSHFLIAIIIPYRDTGERAICALDLIEHLLGGSSFKLPIILRNSHRDTN